jgi:crotonobetainyl-CoA:carnitine CoA-transferase CaiB-like acyl-CoA transferase
MGAIMLAHGIVVALLARERLGVGQEVNTSHLGSMMALQGLNLACRLTLGKEFKRFYRTQAVNPLWNHYKCQDDKWICFAMPQADRYWPDFCKALGITELEKDPRFAAMKVRGKNCEALIAILDKIFAAKPRDEWMKILKAGGDFIYTIVNSVNDLPTDPQMIAIQVMGHPVILSETPADPKAPAPEFGEHTEQILIDTLGYSWEEVAQLKEQEVI